MITFKFYTLAERRPNHNQEIIVLRKSSSFGMDGFSPSEGTCEYTWMYHDDSGSCGYSENDNHDYMHTIADLLIEFDGYIMDETFVWCPVEEYWDAAKEWLEEDELEI